VERNTNFEKLKSKTKKIEKIILVFVAKNTMKIISANPDRISGAV